MYGHSSLFYIYSETSLIVVCFIKTYVVFLGYRLVLDSVAPCCFVCG